MRQIIKKPIVTEKVVEMNEDGVYGFIVDDKANKLEIKQAIEDMYGVNVESVNTTRVAGKAKTRYTKSRIIEGRKPSYKKAYVTLSEGEIIDIYDNE